MIRMTRHVRTKISTTRPTDTPTAIGTMESGGVTNGDMLGVVGLASIVVELVVVEVVGLKRTKWKQQVSNTSESVFVYVPLWKSTSIRKCPNCKVHTHSIYRESTPIKLMRLQLLLICQKHAVIVAYLACNWMKLYTSSHSRAQSSSQHSALRLARLFQPYQNHRDLLSPVSRLRNAGQTPRLVLCTLKRVHLLKGPWMVGQSQHQILRWSVLSWHKPEIHPILYRPKSTQVNLDA